MMEKLLNMFYTKIFNLFFELMQSTFIHKIKFFTNQLFIADLTKEEFESTWEIVCLKKEDGTILDPTMPLKVIKDKQWDVVYTLGSGSRYEYFPVFYSELDNCKDTIYDVFKYRISNQIADYTLSIDEKYENLFGADYQNFIPYFIDNNYIDKVNKMYNIAYF